MKYILTNTNLIKSARLLAEELNLRISLEPMGHAPSIRWGNARGIYNGDTLYNRQDLIHNSRKDILSDALYRSGVPCVQLFTRGEVPERFPVVIRNILNGRGGEGISVVRSAEEFARLGKLVSWSYWRQFSYELGVHIFDGQAVKVFKKLWNGHDENEPEFPIRNSQKGYHFHIVSVGSFPKLPELLSPFYANFPIGFARLDIGWDVENRVYRIIECNSAPCLSSNADTLRMYADFLRGKV